MHCTKINKIHKNLLQTSFGNFFKIFCKYNLLFAVKFLLPNEKNFNDSILFSRQSKVARLFKKGEAFLGHQRVRGTSDVTDRVAAQAKLLGLAVGLQANEAMLYETFDAADPFAAQARLPGQELWMRLHLLTNLKLDVPGFDCFEKKFLWRRGFVWFLLTE